VLGNKPKIIELIEKIPDPRSEKFKKHSLTSIIFIALVGTVCGAND
jgi:predicted transposase YbfD/YdcC